MVGISFATLITVIARTIDLGNAIHRKFTEGREYRRKRFGSFFGELFYWLGILNTEDVQRYHFKINLWSKEEASAWRESYITKCTNIAVAAAIFATAGQSALSLESLTEAHWSAAALLTASMALGIFSVLVAVSLQNSVAMLSNHSEIRLWLSKGLNGRYYDYPKPYDGLLLVSSAATVKLCDAPQLLLRLSIMAYFLGFGLYLLYVWIWELVDYATNYRNNLIFYVCALGAVVAYLSFLWAGRIEDQDQVNQQFNLKRAFDTGTVDKKMEMLEKWTEIVETLTTSKSESEKAEARQAMDDVLYFMRHGERPAKSLDTITQDLSRNRTDGKIEA